MTEREIFLETIELTTPEARAAYLEVACGRDVALRRKVEELLKEHFSDDSLVAGPALEQARPTIKLEVTPDAGPCQMIGRYKLLEKIGEGGFGEVWMAEQREPVKRRVALKIIKPGMDSRQIVVRFEAERQALAMMDHPNIAKIFDAGTTDPHPQPLSLHPMKGEGGSQLSDLNAHLPHGRPYFVMELVRGIKITEYCDHNQLAVQERLALFIKVCQAIQHAHQKGIIHRDIKPSNILVTLHDGMPVPKVIDFGIAKATAGQVLTDQTVFTAFAQFVGTPAYISPEQAEMSGLDIDTRADIYSLGVLLYELLVGRTPFDAREMMQGGLDALRKIIREKEPLRPSTRLTQALAIAGAAGRREPPAGPSSRVGRVTPCAPSSEKAGSGAHGVTRPTRETDEETQASGLRQRLKERITAVRGDLDCIVMKCLEKDRVRRYQTANGLATDIQRYLSNEPILARPPSAAYKLGKTWQRNKLACTATVAVALALIGGTGVSTWQAIRATKAGDIARKANAAENEQRLAAQRAQQAEKQGRLLADAQKAEAGHLLYAANMNLAQQAWEQSNISRLKQLLDDTATNTERGFEWYYWQRKAHLEIKTFRGHGNGINSVAFSSDGQRIVTGSYDQTAKVWDVAGGKELLTFMGHKGAIWSVAFSPDGRRIVTGSADQMAKVWNTAIGLPVDPSSGELFTLKGHSGTVNSVAFSPDGRLIVTGSADQTAKVWEASSGKELMTLTGHNGGINGVAFSPDSRRIVTGSDDQTARLWDSASGREAIVFRGHSGRISSVGFSPDGQWIVTGGGDWGSSDHAAKVWESATGKELVNFKGHSAAILSVAFSPDGRRIVTGSWDLTTKVWDAASGRELLSLAAQSVSAVFSPDGQRIVTGSGDWSSTGDHTAKLWETVGGKETLTLRGHGDKINSVAFCQDGRWILTGSYDHSAKVWEAAGGKVIATLGGHSGTVNSVAFSPDGRLMVTGSADQTAKVWETSSGKELLTFKRHSGGINGVAFSPDSRRIVTASQDRTAKVWDAATGDEIIHLNVPGFSVWSAVFSPDGRWIATGSDDLTAKVWDAATGKVLFDLQGHTSRTPTVAFSPDGQRIVTGSSDQTAKIWEAAGGKEQLTLRGHGEQVWSVGYSPDGRRIVTGSPDGTAKVWDATIGRELLALKGHAAAVHSVAFSPDGRRIVTGSWDHTAKVWDVATDQEVADWQEEERAADQYSSSLRREKKAAEQSEATARANDEGTIKRWLVLAPIALAIGQSGTEGLDIEQIAGEGRLMPKAGETRSRAGGDLKWQEVEDYVIDFSAIPGQLTQMTNQRVAYAVCYIRSEAGQGGLQMLVGAEHEAKIYLNGKQVYKAPFPHGSVLVQDTVSDIALNAGINVLVLKVVNEGREWRGFIRFTDARGNPVRGIKVTLDPEENK